MTIIDIYKTVQPKSAITIDGWDPLNGARSASMFRATPTISARHRIVGLVKSELME